LITIDTGKNFISKEFKHYTATLKITTKSVLVKSHNSIEMVEHYHGLLQQAYQIIITEIPEISKEMALQIAFKAINDTAGLKGLVPILLVFKAYP
jgi:hypothetical protein